MTRYLEGLKQLHPERDLVLLGWVQEVVRDIEHVLPGHRFWSILNRTHNILNGTMILEPDVPPVLEDHDPESMGEFCQDQNDLYVDC